MKKIIIYSILSLVTIFIGTMFYIDSTVKSKIYSIEEKLNIVGLSVKKEVNNYIITLDNSKFILEYLSETGLNIDKSLLNGTKFKIETDDLESIVDDKTVKVYLFKVNKKLEEILEKTLKGKKLLQFIYRKGYEVDLNINDDIINATLKDIDFSFLKEMHKIKNMKLMYNIKSKKFELTSNQLLLAMPYEEEFSKLLISNLSYIIKEDQLLNTQKKIKFDNLFVTYINQNQENYSLLVQGYNGSSNTSLVKDTIDNYTNTDISSVIIKLFEPELDATIKLNDVYADFSYSILDNEIISGFSNLERMLSSDNILENAGLVNPIFDIINHGLTLSLSSLDIGHTDVEINKQKIAISDLGIKANLSIAKNNIGLKNLLFLQKIAPFVMKANVELDEQEFNNALATFPFLEVSRDFFVLKNQKAVLEQTYTDKTLFMD